eukprot:scaffold7831_cov108-Isochrysis_galbana.AAC.12
MARHAALRAKGRRRRTEHELAGGRPRGKARVEVGVALQKRAAQHLGRELHPLPLLHIFGLRRKPKEGAAQLLNGREHRAARLPPNEYGLSLRRQLHAVLEGTRVVDDHQQLLRIHHRQPLLRRRVGPSGICVGLVCREQHCRGGRRAADESCRCR